MQNDYVVNVNAPQTQRVYVWQKELFNDEWFIDGEYCGNCNCNLSSCLPLTKFCPNCGFMIMSTQNPKPPLEKEK